MALSTYTMLYHHHHYLVPVAPISLPHPWFWLWEPLIVPFAFKLSELEAVKSVNEEGVRPFVEWGGPAARERYKVVFGCSGTGGPPVRLCSLGVTFLSSLWLASWRPWGPRGGITRLWELGVWQNEWAWEARKGNKAGWGLGGRCRLETPWIVGGWGAVCGRGLPGGTTSACLHTSAQTRVRSQRF